MDIQKIKKVLDEHLELIDFIEDYIKNANLEVKDIVKLRKYYATLSFNKLALNFYLKDAVKTGEFNNEILKIMDTQYKKIKNEILNNEKYKQDEVFKILVKSLNKIEEENEQN